MNSFRERHLKSLLAYFFAMSLSLQSFAASESYFYIVKKSDVASMVLYRSGLKPIYKKNGFLERLQKVNPEIADLNQIYPGQKLMFSEDLVEKGKSLGLIGLTSENEIYFLEMDSAPDPNTQPDVASKVEVVEPAMEPPPTENPAVGLARIENELNYKSYVALGAGLTFLSFAQNGSETRNLEYSSLMGPSVSLRGGAEWANGYGIDASHAIYPGQLKSSTNAITNSRFNWTTQSLEATYLLNKAENSDSHFHLRAGIQHHDLPYVQLPTVLSADVRKHEIYMATLGFDYDIKLSEKWRSEFLYRYQVPFLQSKSADDIQFQSQFAFDGSLGAAYQLSDQVKLGIFWYGQWQQFNYSMFSEATGQKDNGKNKFFFSNFELRVAYEF